MLARQFQSLKGAAEMRRREIIGFLVGATALLPFSSRAQQPRTPVIGYFSTISKDADAAFRSAFWEGLAEFGFIENQNAAIVYRYADGHYESMQALADELVAQQVDIIVTGPSSPAAVAAKHATPTIPIVFVLGADPVELGLVASYNRPGANVTGINVAPESLTAKRLELLDELVPRSFPIAELINPATPSTKVLDYEKRVASEAARRLGRELLFVGAGTAAEIAPAFEEIKQKHAVGLTIWFEALFQNNREQIVSLANQHRIVTMYPTRNFTELGGLLSYGPNFPASWRQAGTYAGKILRGARPPDLPVIDPTKYELVINLKTANSLSISIPQTIFARADEVIE
jgi:putative tryptophan/tyrosine transport system substrate-binding protein